MSDDRWHSKVAIKLEPQATLGTERLKDILRSLGFCETSDGDLFRVPRQDKVEKWQTDAVVHLALYNRDEEIYFDPDEDVPWTHIECCYLLPWLPFDHGQTFVRVTFDLAEAIGAKPTLLGQPIDELRLTSLLQSYAEDLTRRLEAPGGSFLAQAIYQRLEL